MRLFPAQPRDEIVFKEPLVLLPGSFPRLGVFLDVAAGELLEGRGFPVAVLPESRLVAAGGWLQSVARQIASIDQRHHIESAERQPALNTVAAVEDDPRLPA